MLWSVVSDGDHRASVTLGPGVLVYVQVSVTGQGLERWSPLGQMAVVGSAGAAVVLVVWSAGLPFILRPGVGLVKVNTCR